MANLVDQYLEDLKEIFEEIGKKKVESKDTSGIKASLTEAEQGLEQIKIEIHNIADKNKKAAIIQQIKNYEKKIQDERHALLVGPGPSSKYATVQEREEQNIARLEAARNQLYETEQVGKDVATNLAIQKEKLKKTQNNVNEIDASLAKSNKFLNSMSKWWRG